MVFNLFKKKEKITKVHGEDLFMCPRCPVKMEKLKKGDVIIDVCRKCNGMWVDAGEMEKLSAMAQEKMASPVAEPTVKASEKEDDTDGKE